MNATALSGPDDSPHLDVLAKLKSRTPQLWINPDLQTGPCLDNALHDELVEAEARFARCEGLLAELFPELRDKGGKITSDLMQADEFAAAQRHAGLNVSGTWLVKRDDSLPIAGSIKARGGFHEVLAVAERIAQEYGLIGGHDDRRRLASIGARSLFADHTIMVGSTGNLGLSIGTLAAALGFATVVHMSTDARTWKKDRLRLRGVRVVEHAGDYGAAVAAGRREAMGDPRAHFVDDEASLLLFLGYAAGARELACQLRQEGVVVDVAHPLCVYLPCGVGGAPGGLTYGLKALFGANVHCFFAEPVGAPCMLAQLATGQDKAVSVYDIGLDGRTEADGLAVGLASAMVARQMRSRVSGIFTVKDERLFTQLSLVRRTLGISLEPSAVAAFDGPLWLSTSTSGLEYVRRHGMSLADTTHVVWATGGGLVPPKEHREFEELGRHLAGSQGSSFTF